MDDIGIGNARQLGLPLRRIVEGVASVIPLTYLVLFFSVIFPKMTSVIRTDQEHLAPEVFRQAFLTIFAIHVGVMLLALVVLVYFLYLLYHADLLDAGQKTIWALALFFGNALAFPVFFYALIWKGPIGVARESGGA